MCRGSALRAVRVACLVAAAGCASAPPSGESSAGAVSHGPTIIVRVASFEDAELAAQGRGLLEISVHSADRPNQLLSGALVIVRATARDTLRRSTDSQGIARFDSLPAGDHEVLIRRIGYQSAESHVPIKPGCRTDAEAYIGLTAMGLAPPPPMPARVVVTTCR